jgi:hypothetical protein
VVRKVERVKGRQSVHVLALFRQVVFRNCNMNRKTYLNELFVFSSENIISAQKAAA